MRTLTWHVPNGLSVGAGQRETYRLDGDYNPVRVWVHLKTAPTGSSELILDINVDGESIFVLRPMVQNNKDTDFDTFNNVQFGKDSLVSLDIDQVGSKEPGADMTVGIELEEA